MIDGKWKFELDFFVESPIYPRVLVDLMNSLFKKPAMSFSKKLLEIGSTF